MSYRYYIIRAIKQSAKKGTQCAACGVSTHKYEPDLYRQPGMNPALCTGCEILIEDYGATFDDIRSHVDPRFW